MKTEIALALSCLLIFGNNLNARNHILYELDVSDKRLRSIVAGHYVKLNMCEDGDPNCRHKETIPPLQPEIFYFMNDDVGKMIKYIASDNRGRLEIRKSTLTTHEAIQSDRAFAVRQRLKDALKRLVKSFLLVHDNVNLSNS